MGRQTVDRRCFLQASYGVHCIRDRSPTSGWPPRTTGARRFAAAVKLNTDSGAVRCPNGLRSCRTEPRMLSASRRPRESVAGRRDRHRDPGERTNGGTSWARTILGYPVQRGERRRRPRRRRSRATPPATLVALYTKLTALGGNGHVWTRRSTDSGATWAAAVEIGNGSANASFPAIAGGASGVFRLHYADNRTGSWNAFYRSSTDGGQTWSAEADISDADTGATGKTAAGFTSKYGDYGSDRHHEHRGGPWPCGPRARASRTGPEGSGLTACSSDTRVLVTRSSVAGSQVRVHMRWSERV